MNHVPKLNPVRDRKWLDELRKRRCLISGQCGHEYETVDPCHIGTLGKGIKSSDDECIPLLHRYHAEGHNTGELSMLRKLLPDYILREALRLYAKQMYQDWKNENP